VADQETLPSLRRGIALLEQLAARGDGMSFNEVRAFFPTVPASTVSRLIKTLLDEELICKDASAKNYCVGERAQALGVLLCGKPSRAELLAPVVKALAKTTNQSAAYFEFADDSNSLVVKHEIAEAFHYMKAGGFNTNFAHHGCAKVLLAYQDDETFERIWRRHLADSDWHKADYRHEMETIRRKRLLINPHDDLGYISRIAAPVFAGSAFAGALGVTLLGSPGPNVIEKTAESVKTAALNASKILTRP
jgi:DNA-binding IclR family transcriptional regulator